MNIDAKVLPMWSRALYLFSEQPDRMADFANSFSRTQYDSKVWLMEHLIPLLPENPRVMIIGGWYGTYLIPLLLSHKRPDIIVFNDRDQFCVDVVRHTFGNDVRMHFNTMDANKNKAHLTRYPMDVVINTSCEHMDNMDDYYNINRKCLYAFQTASNDDDPGHINTSQTTDEFIEKSKISTVLYRGSKELRPGKKRMTVIGYKG